MRGIITRKLVRLFSCLLLVLFSFNSSATLLGDEMTANWTYLPNVYFDTNTFVAADGVDLDGEFSSHSLDVTDTSIIVDALYGFGYEAGVQ